LVPHKNQKEGKMDFTNGLAGSIMSFYNSVPGIYQVFLTIFIFSVLIGIYAILVWKFYILLATRDILGLNLRQYIKEENPSWERFFIGLFFFIEYLIITPLIVMVWLIVFSIFILLLSEIANTGHIILVSAASIAAIRLTSYYKMDLSKDLAKMFPLTMLVIFLLNPDFFSVDKVVAKISEIPNLVSYVLVYFVFIVGLEIFLRFIYSISQIFPKEEKVKNIKIQKKL